MVSFAGPAGNKIVTPEELNIDLKKHSIKTFNVSWSDLINLKMFYCSSEFCTKCGELIGIKDFNPKNEQNYIINKECKIGNNITTKIDIKIPSGKMIVAGDALTNFYELDERFIKNIVKSSLQSKLGRINNTYEYARQNVLYIPIHQIPELYKNEQTQEMFFGIEKTQNNSKNLKKLAHVSGQSKAYCVTDYDDFIYQGNTFDDLKDNTYATIVKVEPGTYTFTTHIENTKDMQKQIKKDTVIFTEIHKKN